LKDKMKGLVVGLLVGSMVTGSMAYAANSKTINGVLKELKFKLDGTDKPGANSTGILYDGSVYVPVKSVGAAIGKPVSYDSKTGTVSIGASAIAVYKGGTVTLAEYDVFVAANAFYFGQGAPTDKTLAVKQLIALKLLAAKSEKKFAKEAETAAADSLEQVEAYFGSRDELLKQLATAKLTEAELKQFIKRHFLTGKSVEALVDDKAIKAEYDRQSQADSAAFVNASVRHILVATSDASTGQALRTEDEALARAKEVQTKLKAGGDFAKLAKDYSDDPGSKDNGGLYADAPIAQYVEAFKKAAAELPLNQISDPVKTEFGYHVMKVESRTVLTVDKAKEQLLSGLLQQTFQTYLDKQLPSLIQSIKFPANP